MGNPWPAEPTDDVRKKVEAALELIASRDREKIDQAIAIIEDEILVPQGYPEIDREQIKAQIPGGMISNLHNQLKQQDKLDLMPRILEEVPKVRKDTGYVPLVTPTSQIVGTQASFNVMTGERYKMMSNEFRNLVMGKYGKSPGPVSPEVLAKASPDGSAYTERPASYAERIDIEAFQQEHKDVIRTPRDVLLLLLFPGPAKQFLLKQKEKAGS
jgi:pyruvate/oxaloacetate carboxyltransferase